MEDADGALGPAHDRRDLSTREVPEEPQRDDFPVVIGERGHGKLDGRRFGSSEAFGLGPRFGRRKVRVRIQPHVNSPCPMEIDHRVPREGEQPSTERQSASLVAGQRSNHP